MVKMIGSTANSPALIGMGRIVLRGTAGYRSPNVKGMDELKVEKVGIKKRMKRAAEERIIIMEQVGLSVLCRSCEMWLYIGKGSLSEN